MRSTSRAKTHSWPGSSPLLSPSNGPAWMLWTVMPSPAGTTGSMPRRGGAGEDVDLDPGRGQAPRQLEDVDVHAAGVAGAGLVERRRVHADHGHPANGVGLGELHGVTPSPAPRAQTAPTARSGPVIPARTRGRRLRGWPGGAARAADRAGAPASSPTTAAEHGVDQRSSLTESRTARTRPTPASAGRAPRRRAGRGSRSCTSSMPEPEQGQGEQRRRRASSRSPSPDRRRARK